MTKPITAVAAMILLEECKIRLDDLDKDLPLFQGTSAPDMLKGGNEASK